MSPRTKSVLLLVVTLALGVVLGALLNARLAEERMERIAFLRSQRGFARFIEEAVEPESAEQRAAIREVLRDASGRMAAAREAHRAEITALLDSTRAALDEVLTDEQRERLEERLQTRRDQRFGPRRGRGPGPFGPRRGPPP